MKIQYRQKKLISKLVQLDDTIATHIKKGVSEKVNSPHLKINSH